MFVIWKAVAAAGSTGITRMDGDRRMWMCHVDSKDHSAGHTPTERELSDDRHLLLQTNSKRMYTAVGSYLDD